MYKICGKTYYQRNRDVILNRGKDYYKNDKKRLRNNARDKYINLSEKEKYEKRECRRNRYHNMSEEKKQNLRLCNQKIKKIILTFFFSQYKKWNKKLCISGKMVSLKMLFIKLKKINILKESIIP